MLVTGSSPYIVSRMAEVMALVAVSCIRDICETGSNLEIGSDDV